VRRWTVADASRSSPPRAKQCSQRRHDPSSGGVRVEGVCATVGLC
jgi:hypothetical protein